MSAARRVLLHVQHLLGTGHTRRTACIARALVDGGAEVLVASGGRPLAELDLGGAALLQLPPLAATDASYATLVDAEGRAVDERWRERRAAMLLAAATDFAPDILVLETFPFGRRMLRFELLPLLQALARRRRRPRVFASVRDVLEPPRKPGRAEETVARLREHFEGVLVHGEATLTPLAASFPLAEGIADLVHYTGYVVEDGAVVAAAGDDGRDEVLVSAGGGAVGLALLECAAAASRICEAPVRGWRLLVAPGIGEDALARLRAAAGTGVTVERNRPDFAALLRRCRVSVSQAGYNTLAESVAAGARVVAVPFAEAGEREQGLRARAFAAAGLLRVLPSETLSPAALAAAVAIAAASERPRRGPRLDGAATTARLLLGAA